MAPRSVSTERYGRHSPGERFSVDQEPWVITGEKPVLLAVILRIGHGLIQNGRKGELDTAILRLAAQVGSGFLSGE